MTFLRATRLAWPLRLLAVVLVLAAVLVATTPVQAQEADAEGAVTLVSSAEEPIVSAIYKMRIRELRQFLDERGVACDQCDRIQYLDMAIASKDLPVRGRAEL